MKTTLIAPCGMNCNICYAHLREKDRCSGCRGNAASLFKYCANCLIRNCDYFKSSDKKYCFSCPEYPCKRLKALDKRYRTKYHMSMLDNLAFIKAHGVRKFVKSEHDRWKCDQCGAVISCHWKSCSGCDALID